MSDPVVAPAGVRVGDVLAGKYRVERVLGAGGMGVVVAARHIQLESRVALKFLLPEALTNPEATARFLREARAAVKLTGEHVARVSDVGQLESGAPYIVMEYLEGIDLSAWLQQRGALPIDLAVDFVLQACEAMADAHAQGVVHRDLKPANLFCVQRPDGHPSIKVLDFGISKLTTPDASGHALTRTSSLIGSPLYMSPEQIMSSKNVDARTDIWSLGVILYELLAGSTPFGAESVTELAVRIAVHPAAPLRTMRPEVPPGLEEAVGRCLEKERDRRYPSVAEMALALQEFGTRRAQQSVEAIVGTLRASARPPMMMPVMPERAVHVAPSATPAPTLPVSAAPSRTMGSWGHTGATPGGGRTALIGGLVVGSLVVLLAGGLVLSRRLNGRAAEPVAAGLVSTGSASAPAASAVLATEPVPSGESAPASSAASAPASALASSAPASSAPASSAPPLATVAPTPARPSPFVPPAVTAAPARPAPPAIVAAPPKKADCNPPYEFDSQGNKKWKRECL